MKGTVSITAGTGRGANASFSRTNNVATIDWEWAVTTAMLASLPNAYDDDNIDIYYSTSNTALQSSDLRVYDHTTGFTRGYLHIGVGYTGTNKEAGFTLIFRSDGSGTGTLSFSTTFEGKFIPQDPASSWNYIREVSDSLSSTQANKFIKVNAAGNALEYGNAGGDFISHDDTPSTFTGQGGKFLAVNAGATAVEFVDNPGGPSSGLTQSQVDARVVLGTLAQARAGNTTRWPTSKVPTLSTLGGLTQTQVDSRADARALLRYTAAEKTKLSGIEANAKDDQTAAEIRDSLQTLSGTSRLAATAVKDLPQGPTGSFSNKDGSFIQVDERGAGIEYAPGIAHRRVEELTASNFNFAVASSGTSTASSKHAAQQSTIRRLSNSTDIVECEVELAWSGTGGFSYTPPSSTPSRKTAILRGYVNVGDIAPSTNVPPGNSMTGQYASATLYEGSIALADIRPYVEYFTDTSLRFWLNWQGHSGTRAGNVTVSSFKVVSYNVKNPTFFRQLSDTPNSYTGQAGKFLKVNTGATGLEFTDAPSGGGSTVRSFIVNVRPSATVSQTTTAVNTYRPYQTLMTAPAITAAQAGNIEIKVHVHADVTTSTSGGGERVVTKARLRRTRGSTTTTTQDEFHFYGPRNVSNVDSKDADFYFAYAVDAQAGDVYFVEVQTASQVGSRTTEFNTTQNLMQLTPIG